MNQVPYFYFYLFLCKLGLKMIVKINYLLQFQTIYHAKLSYHTKFYFTATKNTRVTASPIWEVLDATHCTPFQKKNFFQKLLLHRAKKIRWHKNSAHLKGKNSRKFKTIPYGLFFKSENSNNPVSVHLWYERVI